MNHSAHFSDLWGRIDYTGIIILILGDFVSGIYVGFYCEPVLQNTYWTMIGTLGALTVYIVVHPFYQSRQYRLFRLSVFVVTGLSAFAPIIHASRLFPLEQLNKQSGLPYYYAEGGLILLGALIYGSRFPERLYPGQFDIWGGSHQIFHVLVVLATSIHLLGVLNAFEWNYENRRCMTGDRLL